jgi:hypothetical protein
MAPWSWAVWLLLEIINAGLGLWEYIELPFSTYLRWGWYLAYGSALLPALYQSASFLSLIKTRREGEPILPSAAFAARSLDIMQAAGITALFLPLFFRGILFPLAVPALLLIIDPLNFRLKLPSVLGLLAKGDRVRLAAISAAGLFCGLTGEIWNLAGGPSRLYAFPFAGKPLLLGLPLACYAAFPVMALTAFSLYSLVLSIRGGAGTDLAGGENLPVMNSPSWLPPLSYLVLVLVYYLGFIFLDSHLAAMLLGWI